MFIYFSLHLPFENENVYLHLTNLNHLQPLLQASLFRKLHNSGKFPVALLFYIVMVNLNAECFVNLPKSVKNTMQYQLQYGWNLPSWSLVTLCPLFDTVILHLCSKINTNIFKLHRYSLQVHNKLVESTREYDNTRRRLIF